jgi:hypothetical protein
MSDKPKTGAELWAEIYRLRAQIKGPDDFETWNDAAVAEKMKCIRLERELADERKANAMLRQTILNSGMNADVLDAAIDAAMNAAPSAGREE